MLFGNIRWIGQYKVMRATNVLCMPSRQDGVHDAGQVLDAERLGQPAVKAGRQALRRGSTKSTSGRLTKECVSHAAVQLAPTSRC